MHFVGGLPVGRACIPAKIASRFVNLFRSGTAGQFLMKNTVISKKQMRDSLSDDSFLEWLVDSFLVQHFPEAFCVDRSMLIDMHANGLRYARHFGFMERGDQTQFLALMNDVGPDFWRFPGFWDVISRTDLTPDSRISMVYDTVSGAQFETAVMQQDALYWFPHQVENHPLGMT